jgi:hypothetical protein
MKDVFLAVPTKNRAPSRQAHTTPRRDCSHKFFHGVHRAQVEPAHIYEAHLEALTEATLKRHVTVAEAPSC